MVKDLVIKNRSYRRFFGDREISRETLCELIDIARLCPSGRNIQGLRYMIFNGKEENIKIFENLFWAGYLKEWNGPCDGERPSGYIIMLKDNSLGTISSIDEGIAAQSILLGAVEKGLGGCIIANINRKGLKEYLKLDDKYDIELVIALGYPKEEVVIDELKDDGDIKYWRDENKVHHVPKRKLEDILIK
ncbi:MAG TPA: nitroreductase [Clostridium sp.]|nr:nitroreductase [Clostridium sp.]